MPLQNINLTWSCPLFAILFLQVVSCITIFLNIPAARQILLFIYLTFFPGYLIVKLLRFSFKYLETLIFSVGFSVAFLMLFGLALNELGFIAGLSQPLSAFSIFPILNLFTLTGIFLIYWRKEHFKHFSFSLGLVGWMLIAITPLILSVVGAMLVNICSDNRALLLMILVIFTFTLILMLKNKVPSEIYAFAVFIISLSLLYHSSFISRYICTFGSDVASEYFVFRYVQMSGKWSSAPPFYWSTVLGRLNDMLSITILPTVYSNLLDLDSTWTFKIVFPLIFAFVPLCLYQLWRENFGDKYAFISTFFFIATSTFYTELLGLNRQVISELFFALLLFIILNNKMSGFQRFFSFTVFSFGLIVSHYGLAEIFLFFISFVLLYSWIFKRKSNNLTAGMVALFFAIMFAWYIHTSNASVFESLLGFGEYIYRQLGDFFNLEARDPTILRGLGLEPPPTIWNAMSRFFAYITELLIVAGFISFILNKKRYLIKWEYFIFIVEAMSFLAVLIIVPGLAKTMNMTRFYHVLLLFLSPLCVLGAEFIAKLLSKEKSVLISLILLSFVLIPYFLFQSGFIYEVVRTESWSIPLSGYRMSGYRLYLDSGYTDDWNVFSATWIYNNMDVRIIKIYGDSASYENTLRCYGFIQGFRIYPLSNVTITLRGGMVYLNSLNILKEIVVTETRVYNSSRLSFLNEIDLVYSNGGSHVYKDAS